MQLGVLRTQHLHPVAPGHVRQLLVGDHRRLMVRPQGQLPQPELPELPGVRHRGAVVEQHRPQGGHEVVVGGEAVLLGVGPGGPDGLGELGDGGGGGGGELGDWGGLNDAPRGSAAYLRLRIRAQRHHGIHKLRPHGHTQMLQLLQHLVSDIHSQDPILQVDLRTHVGPDELEPGVQAPTLDQDGPVGLEEGSYDLREVNVQLVPVLLASLGLGLVVLVPVRSRGRGVPDTLLDRGLEELTHLLGHLLYHRGLQHIRAPPADALRQRVRVGLVHRQLQHGLLPESHLNLTHNGLHRSQDQLLGRPGLLRGAGAGHQLLENVEDLLHQGIIQRERHQRGDRGGDLLQPRGKPSTQDLSKFPQQLQRILHLID
mmetsp:Transcript_93402/g.213589  ORF Transcript_93402/g.213589 Transcript_93402/m.213589 type:complete len:371 (-) Transcript_93402:462-1574(-)